MAGYIKLHRQLLESYQFGNPNNLKIWIWMLLKASHKSRTIPLKVSKGYTDVKIERGQFIFGRNKAEIELNIDSSTIYRVLKKLESDGSIVVKSNNQYSVITICKYDNYNNIEDDDEQPLNNRRTTDEQPMNTDKKVNKVKKVKKDKNILSEPSASDGIYPACMDLYSAFILNQTGVGAKINSATGSALKKIIAYLKTQVKNKEDFSIEIPKALEFIFLNFKSWDIFHQGQLNLNQIESNLINIINAIKNGKQLTTKQQQSKYAPQT